MTAGWMRWTPVVLSLFLSGSHGKAQALDEFSAAVQAVIAPIEGTNVACAGALKQEFEEYLKKYKKAYSKDEFFERCGYFAASLKFIKKKNTESKSLFKVALNKYADFSPSELKTLGGALHVTYAIAAAPAGGFDGALPAAATAPATTTLVPDVQGVWTGAIKDAGSLPAIESAAKAVTNGLTRRQTTAKDVIVTDEALPVNKVKDAGTATTAMTEAIADADILPSLSGRPASNLSSLISALNDVFAGQKGIPAIDGGAVQNLLVPKYTIDKHAVNPPAAIMTVTSLNDALPELLDYRSDDNPYKVEAMGSVKDQSNCGSSWAATAASLTESRMAIETWSGPPEELSMQELLDCTDPDFGCAGGRVNNALTYISVNGIGYEANNEYNATKALCKVSADQGQREYLGAISQINVCQQRELIRALYYLGPVAAHVKSSCQAFLFYSSGIIDDDDCFDMAGATPAACADAVDHNVLIVGYDTDPDSGVDYWVIQNSFGEEWGEDGYARIKIATPGACGTGCIASFGLTVIPRTFGINSNGKPVFDGSSSYANINKDDDMLKEYDGIVAPVASPVDPLPEAVEKLLPEPAASGGGKARKQGDVNATAPTSSSSSSSSFSSPSAAANAKTLAPNGIVAIAVGSLSGAVIVALVAFVTIRRLRHIPIV